MANSKKRCRSCLVYDYQEKMVCIQGGWYCSIDHAIEYANKKTQAARVKAHKKDIAARKEKLITKPKHKQNTQTVVNAFCILRDRLAGVTNCISCDRPLKFGSRNLGDKGCVDAGHYRSVGSAEHLRFDTRNIRAQCVHCNSTKSGLSGNTVEYRKGLVKLKGIDFVERLESDQRSRHYKIHDMKRIARIFRRRNKLYRKLLSDRNLYE